MVKARSPLLHLKDLQNEMESNFMATPNVSLSTPYYQILQTQDYRPLRASDETMYNTSSVADIDFLGLYEVQQQSKVKETRKLDSEIDPNKPRHNLSSVANIDYSWLTDAEQQLQEVYQEVMDALTLDSEIDPVPDTTYQDAFRLLIFLDYNDVPIPDIGWLMDGGIGFEWRSMDSKGIATMSIYGDNLVIYGASLENGRKDKGTCKLTDFVKLVRFLPMLKTLCSQ